MLKIQQFIMLLICSIDLYQLCGLRNAMHLNGKFVAGVKICKNITKCICFDFKKKIKIHRRHLVSISIMDRLVDMIQRLDERTRQGILQDQYEQIINKIEKPADKIFVCMLLIKDLYFWSDMSFDFKKWLSQKNSKQFKFKSSMLCTEAILYATWLAKLATKRKLQEMSKIAIQSAILDESVLLSDEKTILFKIFDKMKTVFYPKFGASVLKPIDDTFFSDCVKLGFVICEGLEGDRKKKKIITHVFITYKGMVIDLNEPFGAPSSTIKVSNLSDYVQETTEILVRLMGVHHKRSCHIGDIADLYSID